MRIVTGTFSHETNTFSNIPTTLEEFAKQGIAHGDAIPRRFRGTNTIEAAFMDAAEEHGIKLEVVKLPTAKRGFVLLPRRWVVERSFGWMSRFRRLARDYERLPETLAGLHFLAFVILMLKNVAEVLA